MFSALQSACYKWFKTNNSGSNLQYIWMETRLGWYPHIFNFLFFYTSFALAPVLSFSWVLTHFREGAFSLLKHSWTFLLFTPWKRERESTNGTSFPLFHNSLPFCVGGQWEGVIVWLDFAGENKMWEEQSMNVCVCVCVCTCYTKGVIMPSP